MAAPMRNAFWRSIYGYILKNPSLKQYVPSATFCEEITTNRTQPKFDVTSFDSDDEHESVFSRAEDVLESQESFATMFRKSKFVQMGDIKGRTLAGRIIDVIQNDLYIDFGGKFYCVCPRPAFQADQYVSGMRVKVVMQKFEMSSSFMGSDKHVTLLEADCTLMGKFDPRQQQVSPSLSTDASTDASTGLASTDASSGLASRLMAKKQSAEDNENVVEESEGTLETVVTEQSVETEEEK